MKRTGFSIALAAAAVMASIGVALADDAVVTRDSPVYERRTGNTVVNEVFEGDVVDVRECRSNRCRIRIPGEDGWIRQNRLAPIDEEGEIREDIPFRFGITIGPSGPGVSIGIGGDGGSGVSVDAGGGASSGARVCLYEHDGYAGASRCFRRGESVNNLSGLGWNDVASSVRVYGGAAAQICEHAGGAGACYNFNTNTPSLGGFNDLATYIDVY
jgi:hypothetical protein